MSREIIIPEKTVEVFTFRELPADVQQKLIERYQEESHKYFDPACIFEDAERIAKLIGLDFAQNTIKLIGGSRYEPVIYYSGFWSQGDGACFEGSYRYKKGSIKEIKEYAPNDEDLHKISSDLYSVQSRNFFQINARTKHSGHYSHSGCMEVSVERSDGKELTKGAEEDITQALRDFADWIYDQLGKAYDYITSEEAARNYLEDNDQEYTITGEEI